MIVGGGWHFGDGLSLYIDCTHELVLSFEGSDDFTHYPIVGKGCIVCDNHHITNLEVGFCGFPLASFLEMLEILSRPTSPEMVVAESPPLVQRVHLLCREGYVVMNVSGYAQRAYPTRKCPGVSIMMPSGQWLVVVQMGLELRLDST